MLPRERTPPPERVFTITARPFAKADEHNVVGTILHWGWKDEDSMLKGALVDPEGVLLNESME